MSDETEIAIVSNSTGLPYSCSVWDVRTGTNLMNYKGDGPAVQQSVKLIRNEFLIYGNLSKPLLHIFPLNGQDQIQSSRFVMPGRVSCLDISPDGNYCVAGVAENIYIWQIKTGIMLANISKHYQTITSIKFTSDGSHIISSGKDGMVIVWNLTNAIARQQYSQNEPLYAFSDHNLPVTGVYVGSGGMKSILCSVSLDRTCKVYSLTSGILLLDIVFPEPLTSVVIDHLESKIYVGSVSGLIYELGISSPPRFNELYLQKILKKSAFSGHTGNVTCLSLSLDGETLMSAGEDGNVIIWHLISKQIIRKIPQKGPVTNAYFHLTPRCMFDQKIKLNLITSNFQRMINNSIEMEENVIEVMNNENCMISKTLNQLNNYSTKTNKNSDAKEIEALKDEINKLKSINRNLINFRINKILGN